MRNKRTGILVILFAFFAITFFVADECYAASGKSKISIMAKAKSEKSDDDGEDEKETASSLTETVFQTETEVVTLAVSIKNGEDSPVSGKLKWIFISDQSSGKSKQGDSYSPAESEPASFSPGSKEITLEPLSTLEETISADPFVYTETTTTTESYNNGSSSTRDRTKGDVYKGYLVLFIVDGEIAAMKSNSSRYKKDAWVNKCR
jgi:hypothetical protein